jgi:hypothetical protein
VNDDLDEKLKQLGPTGIDDLHAERVRRKAQAVLAAERRLLRRPWLRQAERVWWTAEPVVLAAFCLAYLVWAFDFASKLYR